MAKSRSLLAQILLGVAIVFAIILVVLIATAYTKFHYLPDNVKILTARLPPVDRVEVELVHVRGEMIDGVIATKTLAGPETLDFANLWRDQDYIYGPEVNCHQPGYRVRFYQGDKLLTEATICFNCHNIYFYKYPGANNHSDPIDVNFGAFMSEKDDSNSAKLRSYLADLFPGFNPNVESTKSPN